MEWLMLIKRIDSKREDITELKGLVKGRLINGTNLLKKAERDQILSNLTTYRENGVNIKLRFNIDSTMENRVDEIVEVAKQYAKAVSLSILYPFQLDKQLGRTVYLVADKLLSNAIKTEISRAIPLCIFSEEEEVQ